MATQCSDDDSVIISSDSCDHGIQVLPLWQRTFQLHESNRRQRIQEDLALLQTFEVQRQEREKQSYILQNQIDKELRFQNAIIDSSTPTTPTKTSAISEVHTDIQPDVKLSYIEEVELEPSYEKCKASLPYGDNNHVNENSPPSYENVEKHGAAIVVTSIVEYVRTEDAHGILPSNLPICDLSDKESVRCSSCCKMITIFNGTRYTGYACKDDDGKKYHMECYWKLISPKCKHCHLELVRQHDKKFSGILAKFNNAWYHVECYEDYSGPRCPVCYDVIQGSLNQAEGIRCIKDKNQVYHFNCYTKKGKRNSVQLPI
ncbi:uncharacterized protein TRIADDRAFT_53827 [Trichoplax adhaerens]|uniref:Uncharacterized protein n=1 Tax=Trichoplax adhaerens TaxID=10228 RepID=B3RQ99_TRIAD|nr:predicted protein [Trichoplax adhaerens]EDV27789.1 predicted protein [Trichoplax adhaerens]|eukprot:XP_002109623.1 predicted protein [Trichoplax adhaerens]